LANHYFNKQIRNLDEANTVGLVNNAAALGFGCPAKGVKPAQSAKPTGVGNVAVTPSTPFGKRAKKPANPTMPET
jgi:hypothetical protein